MAFLGNRILKLIHGSCHCGAVDWQFDVFPETATACNCTVCRRYGVLWAYGVEGESVRVSGSTKAYSSGDSSGFHFCDVCGCIAYWRSLEPDGDGWRRVAVNLGLAELEAIREVPIHHFDGLETYKDLPADGRCVFDYWS